MHVASQDFFVGVGGAKNKFGAATHRPPTATCHSLMFFRILYVTFSSNLSHVGSSLSLFSYLMKCSFSSLCSARVYYLKLVSSIVTYVHATHVVRYNSYRNSDSNSYSNCIFIKQTRKKQMQLQWCKQIWTGKQKYIQNVFCTEAECILCVQRSRHSWLITVASFRRPKA